MRTRELDERFMYVTGEPYQTDEGVNVAELAEWLDAESTDGPNLLDCLLTYLAVTHGTPALLARIANAAEAAQYQ